MLFSEQLRTSAEPRHLVSTTGAGDPPALDFSIALPQATGMRRATRLATVFAAATIEGKRASAKEAARWTAELAAAGLD
jgi:hypothetical protein